MSFHARVIDALPMTVYTVDLEGRITSANHSWRRFAEDNGAAQLADAGVYTGRSIFDAIADQASRDQIERAMQLLRSGRVPMVRWEFPCSSPDEERVFLMQITPLHDGRARTVDGFVFSTVDITPSHQSREALIETGIALSRTIDLDRVFQEVGAQVRRAVRCDAFAIALADQGSSRDVSSLGVVYNSGYDGDPADLAERLAPAWADAIAEGRVVLRHAPVGLEITAPMTGSAGALGAMTMLADSLESPQRLDEAERLLATLAAQTAAAVERASLVHRVGYKRRLEAIGEVAAGVAHELRNPLFGISSAAQLLRFRAREDPVIEKNVGRILREVERLNRMVTSLLEYGRPAALRLAAGDPDAVWDEVLEGQRGRLEARSLQMRRTRPEAPARSAIDPEQLAQVFGNLLINAVDAAPEATDLRLASAVRGGQWRCRLTNGGAPIAPDALPRIFEIFFSTKPGGTGIGLALCQRIVEEHGGTISAESSAEEGTTLTVALPLAGD